MKGSKLIHVGERAPWSPQVRQQPTSYLSLPLKNIIIHLLYTFCLKIENAKKGDSYKTMTIIIPIF